MYFRFSRYLIVFLISTSSLLSIGAQIDVSLNIWLPTTHPKEAPVNCLAVSDGILFSGTAGQGLYFSEDGGDSWESLYSNVPASVITDILPLSGTIYVSTLNHGVFHSHDNGRNWETANTGLRFPSGNCLAMRNDTIYLGTNSGLYKKSISMEEWEYCPFPLLKTGRGSYVSSLAVSDSLVVAGGTGVVYLSRNGGEEWRRIEGGFSSDALSALRVEHNFAIGTAGEGIKFMTGDTSQLVDPADENFRGFAGDMVFGMLFEEGAYIKLTSGQGIIQNTTRVNRGLPDDAILDLVNTGDTYLAATANNGVYRLGLAIDLLGGNRNQSLKKKETVSEFRVFPNPAQSGFTVVLKTSDEVKTSVRLMTINGKILKELSPRNSTKSKAWVRKVEITDLLPGTYLIQARSKEEVYNKVLIVQ